MSDALAQAAREILRLASTPVRLGPTHDQEDVVLVPANLLGFLETALSPEQKADRPYISVSPDMKSGTPVIRGHRLGADFIAERYWYLGEVMDFEILDAYELTRADVIVCCWFVAEHGPRLWRKRWGPWARSVWARTGPGSGWWSPDYADVPLPPTRQQARQEAAADGR